MKKLMVLIALAAVAAVGCSKKGGGGDNPNAYVDPRFGGSACQGFNSGAANPFQWRGPVGREVCYDVRANRPVNRAEEWRCDDSSFDGGWGGSQFANYRDPRYNDPRLNRGFDPRFNNGRFDPRCNRMDNNQMLLNYYFSGACSSLNRTRGLVWQEVVLPGTGTTICVEHAVVQNFSTYGTRFMSMNQFPGAMIGCFPGAIPSGCNCRGLNSGIGIQAGIGVGFGPVGFQFAAGANAGLGYQPVGLCY